MFKRKLSDIIISNLSFLKLDNTFYAGEENVLKYFLKKDIMAIFGKDEFTFDYSDVEANEIEIIKLSRSNINTIVIKYAGNEYQILNSFNSLLINSCKDNENLVQIKNYDNKLQNILLNTNDKENVIEIQNIYTYPEKIFEYCKTIIDSDGKKEFPPYRMKQIGSKNKNIEYFALTSLNKHDNKKNLWQKIIDIFNPNVCGVQTSYKVDDILNYVENIYEVMEKECQKTNHKTLKI